MVNSTAARHLQKKGLAEIRRNYSPSPDQHPDSYVRATADGLRLLADAKREILRSEEIQAAYAALDFLDTSISARLFSTDAIETAKDLARKIINQEI